MALRIANANFGTDKYSYFKGMEVPDDVYESLSDRHKARTKVIISTNAPYTKAELSAMTVKQLAEIAKKATGDVKIKLPTEKEELIAHIILLGGEKEEKAAPIPASDPQDEEEENTEDVEKDLAPDPAIRIEVAKEKAKAEIDKLKDKKFFKFAVEFYKKHGLEYPANTKRPELTEAILKINFSEEEKAE